MFWRKKTVPSPVIGGIEEIYPLNGRPYVKYTVQFRDSTGASVDPTSPTSQIFQPNDGDTVPTLFATTPLTKLHGLTGFYYGKQQLPAYHANYIGSWQIRAWGTVDGIEASAVAGFKTVRYDTDDVYTLMTSVKDVTDNLPDSGALTTIDGIVDAIKAVTDNLPDSGSLNDLAIILEDTNELQTNQGDWATATGFATATALQTVDDEVAALQADVTAIKAKTDNHPADLAAELDAIDAAIAGITGVDQYRAWGSAVYDPSTQVLSCDLWISKNGQRLTDPSAYTGVLYESGDTPTLKTTLVGDGSADARGVIHEEVESLTLTHRKLHYMAISVTQGGTPYPNNIAMAVI